jgi:hypothetical protein
MIVMGIINDDSYTNGVTVCPFTNGDNFTLTKVYPQLDQLGMGSGDLIQDIIVGTNTYTYNTAFGTNYATQQIWPREISEPLHYWANTLNGNSVSVQSGYPNVIDGRDLTNSVFSYTTMVYPHPLDQ